MTTDTQTAIKELASIIATEVINNMNKQIEEKAYRVVSDYMESQDFTYMFEDVVKDKIESHVQDYVDGISLSVRID